MTYPRTKTLEDFENWLFEHQARLLWEMYGPKNTVIQSISCFSIGKILILIQNYGTNGFDVYMPCSNSLAITDIKTAIIKAADLNPNNNTIGTYHVR